MAIKEGGFGFIQAHGSTERRHTFFHRADLVGLEFGEQLIEREVEYDLQDSPKGPRAANVRAAR